MTRATSRVSEAEMAEVVQTVLKARPKYTATFAELREIVPEHVSLSKADREESTSRPGEEKWFQIVRNLKAHKTDGFVAVKGGLRLRVPKAKKVKSDGNGKARGTIASASAA